MKNLIPESALEQHIAILGKTGSGKTFAAKGIVEGLLSSGRQVVVIDPTSAWWGLRLGRNGKSDGFKILLLGGDHGDVPLSPKSGEAVARLVTEQRASVVIDTGSMSVGEYVQWFTAFAGTLFSTIKSPLHLVIDEAHHFAPQGKVPDPAVGKMLHACNRLMSGGRSRGIRAILLTQRPAKLHKDSLTCADTLISMRVMAPQDRSAVKDWIDGAGSAADGNRVIQSLASLQRGQGWIWYPEGNFLERVTFPKITTYDSSATPVFGASKVSVKPIDLTEIKNALSEAVKEAEANDPKLLRAKISELERQLKSKKAPPDQSAIDAIINARDLQWKKAIKERDQVIGGLKGRLGKIEQLAHVNGEATVNNVPDPVVSTVRPNVPQKLPPNESELSNYQIDLLDVLVARGPVPTPEGMLATLAKKSRKSSAFSPNLRSLVSSGFATKTKEGYVVTDSGMGLRGSEASAPVSGQDARNYWINRLPSYESGILSVLCNEYPRSLTRDEIAELSGRSQTSSAFAPAIRNLIKSGFAIETDGETAASDVFFEEVER